MIQKDHLLDEHPSNKTLKRKLRLLRAAASHNLDEVRFTIQEEKSGQISNGRFIPFTTYTGDGSEFAPMFEAETAQSYYTSIQFLTSPGYTAHVVDTYLAVFGQTERTIQIEGSGAEILVANMGGESGLREFEKRIARELLTVDCAYVVTDASADGEVYSYLLPREQILNYAYGQDGFEFVTWCATAETVQGIHVDRKEYIYAITREDFGRAAKEAMGSSTLETAPNSLGRVPIHMGKINGENSPMLSLAKMDHDLMNLQREMRKVIRDMGFNVLVMEDSGKRDNAELGAQTILRVPKGAAAPYVINMAAGAVDQHLEYWHTMQALQEQMSSLRRQKAAAETQESKRLDFVQVESVLNKMATQSEELLKKAIQDQAAYLDVQVSVDYDIDREFQTATIDQALDTLGKLDLLNIPDAWRTAAKKRFAKQYLPVSDEELEQGAQELEERGNADISALDE